LAGSRGGVGDFAIAANMGGVAGRGKGRRLNRKSSPSDPFIIRRILMV